MQAIKTLDTKSHTYYCGYISKYERTEEEKRDRLFMIIQKLIGVVAIAIAALSLIIVKSVSEFGIFTVLMALIGVVLTLTKEHVICL